MLSAAIITAKSPQRHASMPASISRVLRSASSGAMGGWAVDMLNRPSEAAWAASSGNASHGSREPYKIPGAPSRINENSPIVGAVISLPVLFLACVISSSALFLCLFVNPGLNGPDCSRICRLGSPVGTGCPVLDRRPALVSDSLHRCRPRPDAKALVSKKSI